MQPTGPVQTAVVPTSTSVPETADVESPTQTSTLLVSVVTTTPEASSTAIFLPSPTHTPLGGGTAILFSSNRGGDYQDLYLLEIGMGEITRLTQGDSNTFPGPFSPNGKQILFTGFGLTHSYVGLMNADGSDPVNLTNQPDVDDAFPAWSPDGSQIAFRSVQNGQSDIYCVKIDGSGMVNLTNNPAEDWSPAWSPDGTLIAFQSNRDGNWEIYVMKTDGINPINLTNNSTDDQMPYWRK
jgi:TolB protein